MKLIVSRTIAWMLGLTVALLVLGAIASTTRNLTIDFNDRYLLRLYAGGIWFIRNDLIPHGRPGSEVYLHRADYSDLALTGSIYKTGADRPNYWERGVPALWLAAACAGLWLFVMRREMLDRRRRWPLVFRSLCIAAGACIALALISIACTIAFECFSWNFRASAAALSLDQQPAGRSGLTLNTQKMDWSTFSPRVLVPWFERGPMVGTAGTAPSVSPGLASPSYFYAPPPPPAPPTWTVSLPLVFPGGLLGLCAWQVRKRMQQLSGNRCPKCFYDLSGLPAGSRCPECGSSPA